MLPDGCGWLSNTGKGILYRINWRRVIQGFKCGPIEISSLVCGPVTWEAKPLALPVQSSDRCMWRLDVGYKEYLISLIVEAATNIRQQPGRFERTRHLCCVVVGYVSRSVAVPLNICSVLV